MTATSQAEIAAFRPYLMRVALARVRDPHRAEEVVQETLLAALRSDARFEGRSAFRTWVTGILVHKVADSHRQGAREAAHRVEPMVAVEAGDPGFDEQVLWSAPAAPWSDPERVLENKRFRAAFTRCLKALPAQQSRAFALREVMGLEPEAVCLQMQVTPNNLCVLLHRARLRLREMLGREWFSAA